MNNKRFYNFTCVIYEDDENFSAQKFNLAQENEVIYIRHDKDVDDEGNDKKPHYHYVIKLKNACTISALSKRVGVQENMIEPVKKSLNGCLKYLIHYGDDSKYQYDSKLVESNSDKLKRKFLDLVTKDVPESDKVESIEDYILNFEKGCYIEWHILAKYVRKINMWDAFRRNSWYFTKLVDSHNSRVSATRYHYYDDEYISGLHNSVFD